MSVSFHKFGGFKNCGFLYIKDGIILSPLVHGGHQFDKRRSGTENVPMIYALGNKVERLGKEKFPNCELRDYLYKKVCEKCEELNIQVQLNGDLIDRLPNNLSLTFKGVNAEALITLLDMNEIYVSAGSACSSGNPEPSRVLKAIGLSDEDAFSTVRISLSADTTVEECDEFVRILGECLESLKILK
jgi:cysteine desulfurase